MAIADLPIINHQFFMPLTEDVSAAIADAMRKHEPLRLGALRMLKAALMKQPFLSVRKIKQPPLKRSGAKIGDEDLHSIYDFGLAIYERREILQRFGE